MAFELGDILGDRGRQALRDERMAQYERDAALFLRTEFAPATRLLSDQDLARVVQLAYRNALARGIAGTRNHLKYLVPVMFWGSRFEADPQYVTELQHARWLDSHGQPTGVEHLDSVITRIAGREHILRSDGLSGARIIEGFQRLYRGPEPATTSYDLITAAMRAIWPQRDFLMTPPQRDAFINLNLAHAGRLQLFGRDAVAYICLAMYLGSGFHEDPRFPWVADALTTEGLSPEARRIALGDAVLTYWDSLNES